MAVHVHLHRNLTTLAWMHNLNSHIENIKEDMFKVPNKAGMEQVCHFFVLIISDKKIIKNSAISYNWPINAREDGQLFRNEVRRILLEIRENYPEDNLPNITPSFLMNPSGDKFVRILFTWSVFLLKMTLVVENGSTSILHVPRPSDDKNPKLRLKILKGMVVDLTRGFARTEIESCELMAAASHKAKELVDEIESIGTQLKERTCKLNEIISSASFPEALKQGLLQDSYDESMAKWSSENDKTEIENAPLVNKIEKIAIQLAEHVKTIKIATTSSLDACLDAATLCVSADLSAFGLPSSQDIKKMLYVDGKLDLAELVNLGNQCLKQLIPLLPLEALTILQNCLPSLQKCKQSLNENHGAIDEILPLMKFHGAIWYKTQNEYLENYTKSTEQNSDSLNASVPKTPTIPDVDITVPLIHELNQPGNALHKTGDGASSATLGMSACSLNETCTGKSLPTRQQTTLVQKLRNQAAMNRPKNNLSSLDASCETPPLAGGSGLRRQYSVGLKPKSAEHKLAVIGSPDKEKEYSLNLGLLCNKDIGHGIDFKSNFDSPSSECDALKTPNEAVKRSESALSTNHDLLSTCRASDLNTTKILQSPLLVKNETPNVVMSSTPILLSSEQSQLRPLNDDSPFNLSSYSFLSPVLVQTSFEITHTETHLPSQSKICDASQSHHSLDVPYGCTSFLSSPSMNISSFCEPDLCDTNLELTPESVLSPDENASIVEPMASLLESDSYHSTQVSKCQDPENKNFNSGPEDTKVKNPSRPSIDAIIARYRKIRPVEKD